MIRSGKKHEKTGELATNPVGSIGCVFKMYPFQLAIHLEYLVKILVNSCLTHCFSEFFVN